MSEPPYTTVDLDTTDRDRLQTKVEEIQAIVDDVDEILESTK